MRNTIDFDEIDENGPQEYAAAFEVAVSELGRDELAAVGPVALEAQASQGDGEAEYFIEGSARFTAEFTCSRCLEPYSFANASAFAVRFWPRPAVAEESEEVEITAEAELDVEFYSERSVPLRHLAFEQVQLSIPMKPLCGENCLGLCSHCGTNRNRETCRCQEPAVDGRWGALQDIREQLSKKKGE